MPHTIQETLQFFEIVKLILFVHLSLRLPHATAQDSSLTQTSLLIPDLDA